MADERVTIARAAFYAEARARFGDDPAQWRFVCPSCGHVASVQDWRNAGAPEGAVAFSCVGRWMNADGARAFKNAGGPCNYTGGGLFKLNPVTIEGDDTGDQVEVFALAPASVQPSRVTP